MSAARDGALSPHFELHEFSTHEGILPPAKSVAGLRRLCVVVLEPMRVRFGVCRVTSGYRTPAHNRAVGGAKNSRHLYDVHPDEPAADVKFALGNPDQWAAVAMAMKVGGVGHYDTHLHVDMRRVRARWIG